MQDHLEATRANRAMLHRFCSVFCLRSFFYRAAIYATMQFLVIFAKFILATLLMGIIVFEIDNA